MMIYCNLFKNIFYMLNLSSHYQILNECELKLLMWFVYDNIYFRRREYLALQYHQLRGVV